MTTSIALDVLKEAVAASDQMSPTAAALLRDLYQPGQRGVDPKVTRFVEFIQQQLELGQLLATSLRTLEPDAVAADTYSDGRPVTTRIPLGSSGSVFTYVHRADAAAEPRVETVQAGGRTFRVTVVDGRVTAVPIGRGEAEII